MTPPFRLTTDAGRRIAVPPIWPGATDIPLWIHSAAATICAALTPGEARQLARHLDAGADQVAVQLLTAEGVDAAARREQYERIAAAFTG